MGPAPILRRMNFHKGLAPTTPLVCAHRMRTILVVIVYTHEFVREAERLWSDEELAEFTDFIARNPESGSIIPGMEGVRKIRWSRAGTGKRGGVRVIYYYYNDRIPIFLFDVYAKSAKEDLEAAAKKSILRVVDVIKARMKEQKQ